MTTNSLEAMATSQVHPWLREIAVAFVPGPMTPLLEGVRDGLLNQLGQVIWEAMDAGYLEVENLLPQGPFHFLPDAAGRMVLQSP